MFGKKKEINLDKQLDELVQQVNTKVLLELKSKVDNELNNRNYLG